MAQTEPKQRSGNVAADAVVLDTFRARARAGLHAAPQEAGGTGPSDYDLNPDLGPSPGCLDAKPAAVLIPVVKREPLSVVLTLRTGHLSAHAGQIAFPGGKIDPGESATDTALREAHEEIGLDRSLVEPLGFLDWYRTRTGFAICPMVGLVEADAVMAANPHEVDLVFEVPLAFLLDTRNHLTHSRLWQGKPRRFYAMPYENHYIWGATAGIIRNLHMRLSGA